MGPRALPLILKELEQRPNHWFWVLRAITAPLFLHSRSRELYDRNSRPLLPEHRGVISEMAQDWLNWARAKGLQW